LFGGAKPTKAPRGDGTGRMLVCSNALLGTGSCRHADFELSPPI